MIIYYCLLILIAFFSLWEMITINKKVCFVINVSRKKVEIRKSNIPFILLLLILFVISASRMESVGRDLMNYIPRYNLIGRSSWFDLFAIADTFSFEIGFTVFCKIMYMFNQSPFFFISMTSLLIGIGFGRIAYLSKMPITTLFMIYSFGLWGSSLNVVRQFISIAILSFGIKYIEQKRISRFIINVIVASLFHSSSIVFLVIYLFGTRPLTSRFMFRFIGGVGIWALIGNRITEVILSQTTYSRYLSKSDGSGMSTLILLIFLFCLFYFFRDEMGKCDINYNCWVGALVVTILLNLLALRWGIFARAMKTFLPYVFVGLSGMLYGSRKRKGLYIIMCFGVVFLFIFYYLYVIVGKTAVGEGSYTYKSIFEKMF